MSSRLLFVLTVVTALTSTVFAAGPAVPGDALARAHSVQLVVDGLRQQLSIPDSVLVTVAPNALVASVARSADRPDTFDLVLDDAFLATLADDELDAAIAHELGHVWIFTHHPYLQTEELANRVALRIVSRDSLERLYQKVWQNGGKGDLQYLPAVHSTR